MCLLLRRGSFHFYSVDIYVSKFENVKSLKVTLLVLWDNNLNLINLIKRNYIFNFIIIGNDQGGGYGCLAPLELTIAQPNNVNRFPPMLIIDKNN